MYRRVTYDDVNGRKDATQHAIRDTIRVFNKMSEDMTLIKELSITDRLSGLVRLSRLWLDKNLPDGYLCTILENHASFRNGESLPFMFQYCGCVFTIHLSIYVAYESASINTLQDHLFPALLDQARYVFRKHYESMLKSISLVQG